MTGWVRTAARAILVVAILAIGAGGCGGGTEPTYRPVGSGASAGGSGDASPTPTSEPSPVEVTWATVRSQPDRTYVTITGRIRVGGMVVCSNSWCGLLLEIGRAHV